MPTNEITSTPHVDAATFIDTCTRCKVIRISSLEGGDLICLLFAMQYGEFGKEYIRTAESESPVRIDCGTYNHVFGLRCLINLPSWSNKCLLCHAHRFQTICDFEDAEIAHILSQMQR
jgi:hypothetical protein